MDFGEQITQLLLVILALLVAFFGVTFWTKRKSGQLGGEPSSAEAPPVPGGAGGTAGVEALGALDEATESKGGGGSGSEAAKRFQNLTGKDAEAAARILKRMLKQDKI